MKIIRNKIIPFKGFISINLFGILFVRGDRQLSPRVINHEEIHTAQIMELLYIFYYIWYLIEWIIRLFMKGNAYKNISFEREANANEHDPDYLSKRDHYSFIRYMRG